MKKKRLNNDSVEFIPPTAEERLIKLETGTTSDDFSGFRSAGDFEDENAERRIVVDEHVRKIKEYEAASEALRKGEATLQQNLLVLQYSPLQRPRFVEIPEHLYSTKDQLVAAFTREGIPVDEKLENRINLAVARGAGLSAEHKLQFMEKHPTSILYDFDQIRRLFVESGIGVSEELDARIKAAEQLVPRARAMEWLDKIEQYKGNAQYSPADSYDEKSLRKDLRKGGVILDNKLNARIKKVCAKAKRLLADEKLGTLEAVVKYCGPKEIEEKILAITDLFIEGGIRLTRDGKLPVRVEDRIKNVRNAPNLFTKNLTAT